MVKAVYLFFCLGRARGRAKARARLGLAWPDAAIYTRIYTCIHGYEGPEVQGGGVHFLAP